LIVLLLFGGNNRDVRIDTKLNQWVWSKGVRNPPRRVRVRLSRKRNEEEDAVNPLYTLVSVVDVADFKGLVTEQVEA
jgi:large subunit ribosomal protein L31e